MSSRPLPTPSRRALILASLVLLGLLAWSGRQPYERSTWLLEVLPIAIAWPVLAASQRRFPLTTLLYTCIFVHAIVLMVGGAYSYARVPFGFYLADLLHLSRNPYDKIGHFCQGWVPALVAREIFIRGAYVRGKKMLPFLALCVALAISACYELFEWATALVLGQGADEFLGTQGDPWDTQSDMFFALIGATAALLLLAPWQDRQIRRLAAPANADETSPAPNPASGGNLPGR